MNNPKIDILLYAVSFIVILWLFVKTQNDYKKLTSSDKKNKNNVIINPRSFIWKGGIFIFAALYLAQTAVDKSLLPLILFASLAALGGWNIYHAILYRNWQKRK